jgi:2-polyprenyl-3-methyl-5-hydroxy-6-metoxy-1,4-benzoquinol methylase
MPNSLYAQRIYENAGNPVLLSLVGQLPVGRALDCGCGAGDNARAFASRGWEVSGITISPAEEERASRYCKFVYLHDLELGIPPSIDQTYNLVVFSHVLEHLRNPDHILREIKSRLEPTGYVVVALPNVLHWRNRLQFLLGRFEYETGGIMDNTHIKFYTFKSGERLLTANGFEVITKLGDGSFPLPYFRRLVPQIACRIDRIACRLWPGLFAWQLLYVARLSMR